MKKESASVEVYVSESGHICIKDTSGFMEDIAICFHPDQVPLILKWIKECQKEAKEMSK